VPNSRNSGHGKAPQPFQDKTQQEKKEVPMQRGARIEDNDRPINVKSANSN
jgi:hypothetical protein